MFRPAEKVDVTQISLTGARALVLLGLLAERPRSFEEIKNAYIYFRVMDTTSSDDIIRIDMNTLKSMGCDISRCSSKTHEYTLTKNLLAINITSDEVKVLKRVYKRLKTKLDLPALINLDKLIKKIAFYVNDIEIKEELLGLSFLKHCNTNSILDLIEDCKQNMVLTLIYKKTPTSKDEKKEIIAQKLAVMNDKVYLRGYDINKKDFIVLYLKRIKAIIGRKLTDKIPSKEAVKVLFKLSASYVRKLSDEEQIISSSDDFVIVEGNYYNKFFAMQRIFSFAENCTVLEPSEFKDEIIQKLKEMRELYG